jgi:two-component system response regulator NreC
MDKIKVLVVDDHTLMRDGIRALLRADGDINIVGEASEGKGAIQQAQELAPDVIIMDIAMSGVGGLEATRKIKNRNSKVKILILTQYAIKEYMLGAIKAGADGYLPKIALGKDLLSAIHEVYAGAFFLYPAVASALVDEYQHQSENADPHDLLTPRQRQTIKLIADGHNGRNSPKQSC